MLYDDKGRRVLYWHDPMVPGQKFDKPGKSPFMDMQLVPVYADEGVDEGTVKVSPRNSTPCLRAAMAIVVAMHVPSAVATRSVGENASP